MYKVNTDAIALKVKQEFASKDTLKTAPKAASKTKKKPLEFRSREREGLPIGAPFRYASRTPAQRFARFYDPGYGQRRITRCAESNRCETIAYPRESRRNSRSYLSRN